MGMADHDHHKMMIADFRKRFYIVGYDLCIKSKPGFIALTILMFSRQIFPLLFRPILLLL